MYSLELIEAILTGGLTSLSLLGCILVLISYAIACKKSNPKISSKLIRNLAISDCVWFFAMIAISLAWIIDSHEGEPGQVPDALCIICSPLVSYGRMSSL